MNSAEELQFVLKNNLSNKHDFFLGGTTDSSGFISSFSDYIPNSSGIVAFILVWHRMLICLITLNIYATFVNFLKF